MIIKFKIKIKLKPTQDKENIKTVNKNIMEIKLQQVRSDYKRKNVIGQRMNAGKSLRIESSVKKRENKSKEDINL